MRLSKPNAVAVSILAEPFMGADDTPYIPGEDERAALSEIGGGDISIGLVRVSSLRANYEHIASYLPFEPVETKQYMLAVVTAGLTEALPSSKSSLKFDLTPKSAQKILDIANACRGRDEREERELTPLRAVFLAQFNHVAEKVGLGLQLENGPDGPGSMVLKDVPSLRSLKKTLSILPGLRPGRPN